MADLTTLDNCKSWLKLSDAQMTDDLLLARLISASSTLIQSWLNRQIVAQNYIEVLDGQGNNQIVFANYPVSNVTSLLIDDLPIPVSIDGGVLQTGYGFDAERLWVIGYQFHRNSGYANDFSRGRGNVTVSYTAGYATVPFDIEQACIELVAVKYRMRDRIGQKSIGMGGESTSFDTSDIPAYIQTLLMQYRKLVPN